MPEAWLPTLITMFSVLQAPEIITKVNIGKLILPEPSQSYIPSWLASNQFESLPIQMNHVLQVSLPNHHRPI